MEQGVAEPDEHCSAYMAAFSARRAWSRLEEVGAERLAVTDIGRPCLHDPILPLPAGERPGAVPYFSCLTKTGPTSQSNERG